MRAARSTTRSPSRSPTRSELRHERRRRLGMGLIAFGVTGLVLIGAAGGLVLASLGAVDDAATNFDEQRTEILAMLGPASTALESASSAAGNAGTSLAETRDAAMQAAELMTRLAASFESLATLGTFEVFGTRPFGSLTGQFETVADQSRTLSADLAEAAGSMNQTIDDSATIAGDLGVLARQLSELEASLDGEHEGQTPAASAASLPVDAARFVLVGLLLWLAVPAIVATAIGWRWSRAAPEA